MNTYPKPTLMWFGPQPEDKVLEQATQAMDHPNVHGLALMADNHLGYSVPIGSVLAYRNAVSPSAVGYDIGCGVKAVRTNIVAEDFFFDDQKTLDQILDEIQSNIAFGVGRTSGENLDHAVMDSPLWKTVPPAIAALKQAASQQLGTVGGGNHYVDILMEEPDSEIGFTGDEPIWVACHFGSRGLGHKTATHFLREGGAKDGIMERPLVFTDDQGLFYQYLEAMRLAGEYAYAGRDVVIDQVLGIIGTKANKVVHNHHNFAWLEEHYGEELWVVRKGATPAQVGQEGFIGGSMGDIAVVVEGDEGVLAKDGYRSTVHGAGRIHSRTWAKGKHRKGVEKVKGNVTRQMMSEATKEFGVKVRGGDVDESPFVYRKLAPVLEAQGDTIAVTHNLRPIGVVMADARTHDPWKD